MKNINDIKQYLTALDMLVTKLDNELNYTRTLLYRCPEKHGHNIELDVKNLSAPHSLQFIYTQNKDKLTISYSDLEKINMESEYQKIQELKNKLGF